MHTHADAQCQGLDVRARTTVTSALESCQLRLGGFSLRTMRLERTPLVWVTTRQCLLPVQAPLAPLRMGRWPPFRSSRQEISPGVRKRGPSGCTSVAVRRCVKKFRCARGIQSRRVASYTRSKLPVEKCARPIRSIHSAPGLVRPISRDSQGGLCNRELSFGDTADVLVCSSLIQDVCCPISATIFRTRPGGGGRYSPGVGASCPR